MCMYASYGIKYEMYYASYGTKYEMYYVYMYVLLENAMSRLVNTYRWCVMPRDITSRLDVVNVFINLCHGKMMYDVNEVKKELHISYDVNMSYEAS